MEETVFYLSGPMTGLPEYNYATFERIATKFRQEHYGMKIRSPHEVDKEQGSTPGDNGWEWYMRHALTMQLECNAIIMLPGWTKSRGARAEFNLALDLGYMIYFLNPVTEQLQPLDEYGVFYA